MIVMLRSSDDASEARSLLGVLRSHTAEDLARALRALALSVEHHGLQLEITGTSSTSE
jgi:hypothetical protein